ncbi:related to ketopantoate reductase [Fusarium oxysporum]|uniref:2-dehydropantoate 2-reductase n=1 Tax=Fusarium oxysporum TaxID=5507 RepID=A0A2H3SMT8_FUSOX|nr:related to ketopantoate reductase [Fusarium oxysporum]
MAKSRILVVGMGGIGTIAAYALEKNHKAEVTAVMRSNYDAAAENGIDIDSVEHGQIKAWRPTAIVKSVPDVFEGDIAPFDYILVTTKNIPDIKPTVADIIAPAVTPGKTAIVLSQNGINIEKPLVERFPINPLISSVVYTGANETTKAKVYTAEPDTQKIGAFVNPKVPSKIAEEAAKRYVGIYNPNGNLNIIYEPDVAAVRWRKLAYNSSFNPVSSILRMDTTHMRMSRHIIEDLILPIIEEIRTVAKASGVMLQEDLIGSVMAQDSPDEYFKPSMCQDHEKGQLMEIENIVGEVVREGKKYGVLMPTLRVVYGIMKGLQLNIKEERGLWKAKWEPDNPYLFR